MRNHAATLSTTSIYSFNHATAQKTDSYNFIQPPLEYVNSPVHSNSQLNVPTLFQHYLRLTATVRKSNSKLFIDLEHPELPISIQKLRSWAKQCSQRPELRRPLVPRVPPVHRLPPSTASRSNRFLIGVIGDQQTCCWIITWKLCRRVKKGKNALLHYLTLRK